MKEINYISFDKNLANKITAEGKRILRENIKKLRNETNIRKELFGW